MDRSIRLHLTYGAFGIDGMKGSHGGQFGLRASVIESNICLRFSASVDIENQSDLLVGIEGVAGSARHQKDQITDSPQQPLLSTLHHALRCARMGSAQMSIQRTNTAESVR